MDKPKDEAMVRQTPALNLLHYFVPGTLEQGAAFNALNMSSLTDTDENWTVRVMTINTFLCPSDGGTPDVTATLGTQTKIIGATSYPNNIGTVYTVNGGGGSTAPPTSWASPARGGPSRSPRSLTGSPAPPSSASGSWAGIE
jgi:hypothetical protein